MQLHKINLAKLKSVVRTMKSKSGMVEYLIIPIEENHLYKGEKGIYLDLVGWEIKDPKGDNKQTHLIKQSFPKEVLEAMTEEEKAALPILGGTTDRSKLPTETTHSQTAQGIEDLADDLPF